MKIFRLEVPSQRLNLNVFYPELIIMGELDDWIKDNLAINKIFQRTTKTGTSYYFSHSKWKFIPQEITDKDEYVFLKDKIERISRNKHSIISKKYNSKSYIVITISTKRIEKSLGRPVTWNN